jgi:putative transposase
MLCIIDEFTREALAIRVARKIKSADVIEALADLFILRGLPAHIRSDNGPEFVALALRKWIAAVGAKIACIEPGSPWETGYCESFSGKLRDELLNGEIFYSLKEAKTVIETWRRHYNTIRPNSSLGYRPPAPEALVMPATAEIKLTSVMGLSVGAGQSRSPASSIYALRPKSLGQRSPSIRIPMPHTLSTALRRSARLQRRNLCQASHRYTRWRMVSALRQTSQSGSRQHTTPLRGASGSTGMVIFLMRSSILLAKLVSRHD